MNDSAEAQPPANLATAEEPRVVVRAAGAWLGDQLAGDGFVWVPSQLVLQRTTGSLREQIHVQASRYNRRGERIIVQTMLNVRDTALRRWRKAHPELVTRQDDFLCGHFLGYAAGRANGYVYGDVDDGEIDLLDPEQRIARLGAFVSTLRAGILPWFAGATDPDKIIGTRAAEFTAAPAAIVEWFVSLGRADLVTAFMHWYLAKNPGARDGVERGAALAAQGDRLQVQGNVAVDLGWVVTRSSAARP